jgi:malate/lactate dehydrogenase
LGRGGMERIIEYELNEDELEALRKSAAHVRETIASLPV